MSFSRVGILWLAAGGLSACLLPPPGTYRHDYHRPASSQYERSATQPPGDRAGLDPVASRREPSRCRRNLVSLARSMKERPRYRVGGLSFSRDCSGFVQALLVEAGFPLEKMLPASRRGESGSSLLYRMARGQGRLHRRKLPAVGDLVFFDHTYDRNRNGRIDDPLTHVGMVVEVDPDGTATLIHRVGRGVVEDKLNLYRPGERQDPRTGKELNSHLRRRRDGGSRRLTGELFRAFATLCR